MNLRYAAPLVILVTLAGPAQVTRAEPVSTTIGAFLFRWVIGQGLSALVDRATGKPNIREMRRELDALALTDRANAAEIRRLRDALDEKMSRREVESLIMASLARVDSQLAEHAVRIRAAEERLLVLEAENKVLRERMALMERRGDQHEGAIKEQGRDLATHADQLRIHGAMHASHKERSSAQQEQLNRHEARFKEHEDRIRKLELTVGPMGAQGFALIDRGQSVMAIEKFDEALSKDRGDPGLYYGKGIAMGELGRWDEGRRLIAIGVEAERERPLARWYTDSLPRVQGRTRTWYEGVRDAARTTDGSSRTAIR